jgi:hypothetical protein
VGIAVERPEKAVQFCTNLNLQADHERAVAALAAAQANASRDPREVPPQAVRAAAEMVQALEVEMRAHTVIFVLRGWPRKRFAEFEETHRPRQGNEADKAYSLDLSALDDALSAVGEPHAPHKWPRTIVRVTAPDGTEVPFDPHTEWVPLADEMTNAQYEDFAVAFLIVNRGVKATPFSEAASRVIQRSERSSS